MVDYNFRCDECGQQCFVELDIDSATISQDGENLEFNFDYTCESTGQMGDEDECGAEYSITAYSRVHSIMHEEN
jgi:hypothetical protein